MVEPGSENGRNFPETGEQVTNTKKNSLLRRGNGKSSGLFFLVLVTSSLVSGKFLLYIQTKLVTDQYQFQQDHFGGLFMRGRNIYSYKETLHQNANATETTAMGFIFSGNIVRILLTDNYRNVDMSHCHIQSKWKSYYINVVHITAME